MFICIFGGKPDMIRNGFPLIGHASPTTNDVSRFTAHENAMGKQLKGERGNAETGPGY